MLRATLLLCMITLLALGCGGAVKTQNIEVKPPSDPLAPAKTVLNRYANGEPLGSEVTSFPFLIGELKKTDPERASILENGLAEIQKSPNNRVSKAKEILQKLKQ